MKTKVSGIVFGVILIICVIIGAKCTTKVPAGYAACKYNMSGGVQDDVLTQGWHIISPTTKTTNFTIGIEQSYLTKGNDGDSEADESFEVPTSDGKGLTVEAVYSYRYDIDRLPEIFTRFKGISGKEINETFSKPNVKSWIKEVTAKYPVTEILGEQRSAINVVVYEYLKEKFAPYGIIIENASLTNIDPDETTRQAIQQKVNAQQAQELAAIEAKTAKINADKEKEVALIQAEQEKETAAINAEKARIKAEGEADATRIKASAEAESNRMIAESLTPELIESQKINKWTGEVPMIQGQSTPIVGINTNELTNMIGE